jgi:hypothetical protein
VRDRKIKSENAPGIARISLCPFSAETIKLMTIGRMLPRRDFYAMARKQKVLLA